MLLYPNPVTEPASSQLGWSVLRDEEKVEINRERERESEVPAEQKMRYFQVDGEKKEI